MYGASSTIGHLWYNQSAAALGNLVGGAIFIGLAAHIMNHWKSPIFISDGGTLLGHDVESTTRARHVDFSHYESSTPDGKSSESTPGHQTTTEGGERSSFTVRDLDYPLNNSTRPVSNTGQGLPTSVFITTNGMTVQENGQTDSQSKYEQQPSRVSKRWGTNNCNKKADPARMV